MTQANVLAASGSAGVSQGFKNRIINGGMVIDQRNAGASVTPTNGQYTLDRWYFSLAQTSKLTCQQNAGSVTPPVGFKNYLGITSSSAYTVGSGENFNLVQRIEGFNVADLGWGTANAKTVTLSFQVYSSLTGTFGGSITNSANNRSYPFSYTVSSANTWVSISVIIAGDTTGTWVTDNGVGMTIWFGLGVGSTYSTTAGSWAAGLYLSTTGATSVVGTNGATFYITGVQLEVGASATNFEVRDYGRELILCQRYFEKSYNQDVKPGTNSNLGNFYSSYNSTYTSALFTAYFAVEKRTAPTMTGYTPGGVSGSWYDVVAGNCTATFTAQSTRGGGAVVVVGGSSAAQFGQWTASAEL